MAVWPSLVQCVGPRYSEDTTTSGEVDNRKRSREDNTMFEVEVEEVGDGVGLLLFRIRVVVDDDDMFAVKCGVKYRRYYDRSRSQLHSNIHCFHCMTLS